jgi:MFS family permease
VLASAPSALAVGVAVAIWGAAASVYHPAGLSMLSTGAHERGRALAYHGIAGNLGIAIGPFVVAVALMFAEWRTVALALALPIVAVALLATRIDVDETAAVNDGGDGDVETDDDGDDGADNEGADGADDDGGVDAASDSRSDTVDSLADLVGGTRRLFVGGFVLIFPIVVCSGLYYRGVLTFLPTVLSEYEAIATLTVADLQLETYRYAYAGLLAVGVLGQYAGGRASDALPPARGLALGFTALGVLALVFLPAATAGLVPLLVVGFCLGVALFFVQPLYQAAVADYTPPGSRGLSYGYTYVGVFGVGALGGAIAGGILEYATASALFAVLAGIAGVGAVTALGLASR